MVIRIKNESSTSKVFQMSLSVDSAKDEIRQYAPEVSWLVNAFGYVGGIAKGNVIAGMDLKNFRGCIKKVSFENGITAKMSVILRNMVHTILPIKRVISNK